MKSFMAEADIQGSAETVWRVLTDASSYPEWDPNMERIEGTIGLNEKLVLYTGISSRAFKVTVSELIENSRMVWKSGMPMGLFKGERTFTIEPRGNNVHFHVQEVFSGPLSPLFERMIPNLQPTFDKFVEGLKAEVEESSSPATSNA